MFLSSGDTVFCSGAAATPNALISAMVEHGKKSNLEDVTVCHMHTEGPAAYALPENAKHFRSNSFFMGGNVRKAVAEGRGDNFSIFLHEIPLLFHRQFVQPDVTLVHVSPPDRHGFCSLGTSVDCVRTGLLYSKKIIGEYKFIRSIHFMNIYIKLLFIYCYVVSSSQQTDATYFW